MRRLCLISFLLSAILIGCGGPPPEVKEAIQKLENFYATTRLWRNAKCEAKEINKHWFILCSLSNNKYATALYWLRCENKTCTLYEANGIALSAVQQGAPAKILKKAIIIQKEVGLTIPEILEKFE